MNSIGDLFKKLGGNTRVGAAIGKGQTTVSEMKRRNSIPTRHWPALLYAARTQGVDLTEADLLRINVGDERFT